MGAKAGRDLNTGIGWHWGQGTDPGLGPLRGASRGFAALIVQASTKEGSKVLGGQRRGRRLARRGLPNGPPGGFSRDGSAEGAGSRPAGCSFII